MFTAVQGPLFCVAATIAGPRYDPVDRKVAIFLDSRRLHRRLLLQLVETCYYNRPRLSIRADSVLFIQTYDGGFDPENISYYAATAFSSAVAGAVLAIAWWVN